MGRRVENKISLTCVSVLGTISIGLLYIDLGLRGSFSLQQNLQLFLEAQILHFSFRASLFDVVLLAYVRCLLVAGLFCCVKKFQAKTLVLQGVVGLLFSLFKAVLLTSFFNETHALDDLQWAVLFVSSGYSLLEIFMALLARTNKFTFVKREREPLLEMFNAPTTTVPAERMAIKGSEFVVYRGVSLHYCVVKPRADSWRAIAHAKGHDSPLVVCLHATGGCAATFSASLQQMANYTGLTCVALDRPGWGLASREPGDQRQDLFNSGGGGGSGGSGASQHESINRSLSFGALADLHDSVDLERNGESAEADEMQRSFSIDTQSTQYQARLLSAMPLPTRKLMYTDGFVADCVAFLTMKLGYEKAVIIAHGDAIKVALRCVVRHPRLVVATSLVAPNCYSSELPWNQQTLLSRFPRLAPKIYSNFINNRILKQGYFFDSAVITPSLTAAFRSTLRITDWEEGLRNFANRTNNVVDKELGRLMREQAFAGVPIMIVCGEADKLCPMAHSVQLATELDAVKFQTLRSCGHAPHIERKTAFCQSLVDFLLELELIVERKETVTFVSTTSALAAL